jgi:hypothetical protein
MTLPPPDSGRRSEFIVAVLAALLLALLLPACGDEGSENRIKPIQATLSIDPVPVPPAPAQAVYFVKDPKDARFPDLETVQVRLFTASPIAFDAYTLEIHFDPTVVQVGDVFEYGPGILGGCFSETACEPECMVNTSEVNSTGILLLGVAAFPSCPATSISSDTMLLKIGFIAQSTIDPPGSPIDLIVGPSRGDCEILLDTADLGIPFVDGNATMTASR